MLLECSSILSLTSKVFLFLDSSLFLLDAASHSIRWCRSTHRVGRIVSRIRLSFLENEEIEEKTIRESGLVFVGFFFVSLDLFTLILYFQDFKISCIETCREKERKTQHMEMALEYSVIITKFVLFFFVFSFSLSLSFFDLFSVLFHICIHTSLFLSCSPAVVAAFMRT